MYLAVYFVIFRLLYFPLAEIGATTISLHNTDEMIGQHMSLVIALGHSSIIHPVCWQRQAGHSSQGSLS